MGYLDSLFKNSKNISNNFNSLGDYSPLSGFSNEDELEKNPYQQILSSIPKENEYSQSSPLKSGWLDDRSAFNRSSSSIQIPDGMNIDSTFYNRKDIYDLKQRLEASGVEMPETKKDKPGALTRILDFLSTPGYAVTTALYNAFDGDKDTKTLKGLLDGVVGGLTSNSDKYKEGSDLVDLMVGEQKKDAGIGEKVGRFAGGMALDILLDPTTYLTFGTSALVKGATKKVGQEVTEDAVKNAIKGVADMKKVTKVGDYLDLDKQAKRITKQINENAVKHRDGLRFDFKVPFTKIAIEKEFISAEKISEIGKALGIQDTLGKTLNKGGDLAKGVWNFKKHDDGIREALEKIPEAIGRHLDTAYDLKKEMRSDPLKYAQKYAGKEIDRAMEFTKKMIDEDSSGKVKELIEIMQDIGMPFDEMSSIMEQVKTHTATKEFDPDAIIKMIKNKYMGDAETGFKSAKKGVQDAEIEMRKRAVELLRGKLVEFDEQNKLDTFLKNNGIKVDKVPLDEKKKLMEDIEKSKIPTPEELGVMFEKPMTLEEKIADIRNKNGYETDWEIYADDSREAIEQFISDIGMDRKDFDDFLNADRKTKDKVIENIRKKQLQEFIKEQGLEVVDGKVKAKNIEQKKLLQNKINEINSNASHLRTRFDDINKAFKKDKKLFIDDNSIDYKPYKTATTVDELESMVDEILNADSQKVIDKSKVFEKQNNLDDTKTFKELYEESGTVSKTDINIDKETQEVADKYFGLDGDLEEDIKTSKKYFMEAYKEAFKNGKLDADKTMMENWNMLNRRKISENITTMLDVKDNILFESGLKGVKGAEQFLDKLIENKVQNMLNPKSIYFDSPYKTLTKNTLKKEFLKYFNGKDLRGKKIPYFTSFSDIAKKLNDYDNFMNGTSKYFEGSMPKLFGLRSNFNESVEGKLRTEAVSKIKQIMHGRKIDSSSSKIFDEAIRFRHKNSDKVMKLDDVLNMLNKPIIKDNKVRKKQSLPLRDLFDYDTLPEDFLNEWEQLGDGGILAQLNETLRREFREKYKGSKYYELPKKEREDLIRRVNRIVEDITDSEHFGGNYDVLTGQNITNYSDTLRRSEQVYDNYNGKPLRQKNTYNTQEYLSAIDDSKKLSDDIQEELYGTKPDLIEGSNFLDGNAEDFIRETDKELGELNRRLASVTKDDKPQLLKDIAELERQKANANKIVEADKIKTKKGILSDGTDANKLERLSELRYKVDEEVELLKSILNDGDISYSDKKRIEKILEQRSYDIKAINKEIDTIQGIVTPNKTHMEGDFKNGFVSSTEKANGRNTVVNTKSWGQPKETINASKVLDEAPKKYSSPSRDAKIQEFQEEYTKARQQYLQRNGHNVADIEAGVKQSLPDGVKMEKIVGNEGNVQKVMDNVNNRNIGKMSVKELRQMLTDAGIKGISNAKREKLVEIANIINSKNIRASVDLTKKTPEEMKALLKSFGIKDEQFNEAMKKFTGYTEEVKKFQATKDAIEGAWNDKNIQKFTDTMENLYGNGFIEKWNYDIDKLKSKAENFKNAGMVAKSPIELIRDNQEVIDMLGGGEKAEEFLTKYVQLMSDFAQDEISWGIFVNDNDLIKSQGYVARRMSDETREILNADKDKNLFIENWFKDRANLIVDDPKFAKHRIDGYDGKKTIAEINEAIYQKTLEEFGEEGAIKNFFEKDLARIMIQRAYEHGNAFYDKNLQSMYLGKMGVKIDWAIGKDGGAYNIVENVNGKKWVKSLDDGTTLNEIQTMIKTKNYDEIRKEINSFSPNESYLPDGKLQKVLDNANKSLDRLENYLKAGSPDKKKLKELTNDLYANMPQRAFARELKAGVKSGEIKLVYPTGMERDITVTALKDSGMEKILTKKMNESTHLKDYSTLSWEDFETIKTTTNQVPVYAVDRTTYEAYQKAMTKQFVQDSNSFLKLYDKITNTWKKMATTSVGFHTRNFFGNFAQMYLDVGEEALKTKWLKVAHEVSKDSAEVLFTTPDGIEYTGKMVNDLFKEVGLGDATQLSEEFNKARKGKKTIDEVLNSVGKSDYERAMEGKNPIEKLFAYSEHKGNQIEQFAKRQQFAILLSKGHDPLEAKKHIDKFLFDYSDITDFERDFMKRIIPFYTFMKKNAELQFDTILHNPTPVKTVRRMLDNQRKAMLSTEERQLIGENDNDKIITEIGGKKRTISTNLPWLEDVNLLGALNPIIKTPMELATNKNFTYGNDIATYNGQVKEASLLEGLLGSVLGQTEIGADGNKYIDAKAKHLITNALPSVRTADRSLANVTADDKLGGLMALLGLGGQEFNVDKRTSQQVREYKELLENLEKKAQSKGIDTRKKLKEQQELQRILGALGL